MAYTGSSIVDYLKSINQPSDFSSRVQLATRLGIKNYTGSQEQNDSLLRLLKEKNQAASTVNPLTNQPYFQPATGGTASVVYPSTPVNPITMQPYFQPTTGGTTLPPAPMTPPTPAKIGVGVATADKFLSPPSDIQPIEPENTGAGASLTIPPPGTPTVDNNAQTNIAPILASFQQLQQQIATTQQQRLDEERERAKEASEQQKGLLTKVSKWVGKQEAAITGRKSVEQITKDVYAEYGITAEQFRKQEELIVQMNILNQQIDVLNAEEQERLLGSENRLAPMTFIRGEQALIQKQYAIKRNSLAAQANTLAALYNARSDKMVQARQIAGDIVKAATYDQETTVKEIGDFIALNRDIISTLDKTEQDALNNIYKIQQDELTRKQNETTQIVNLMLQTPNANWTGFDITKGTLTEAAKIAETGLGIKTYEAPTSYQEWELAGRPGAYEQWLEKGKAPTSTTGMNYNTRLKEEINNLYAGRYGTEGAREKVIKLLQAEFPTTDVTKDIYARVPDGWEKQVKGATKSLEDIKISTKAIFQQYKDAGYARKQIEDQWKADNNTTTLSPLIQDILDELFPTTKQWWEFWK